MILKEAREWIGTPYQHHQRLKGVGVDCVGLIVGVGLNLDLFEDFSDEAFKEWNGYSRTPNPVKMGKGMMRFLRKVDEPRAGDIAWIQYREGLPMHLAILTERNTYVHACGKTGRVIEARITDEVNSWWRYPLHG